RKGAPKHIDQTVNNHLNAKKTTGGGGGVQLIVKMPSLDRKNHDDDDDDDGGDGDGDEQQQETKISTKRTSPRRKPFQTNGSEKTNPKKKFKR
ncbi:unnamed protein product, partial [Rotaria socialis]